MIEIRDGVGAHRPVFTADTWIDLANHPLAVSTASQTTFSAGFTSMIVMGFPSLVTRVDLSTIRRTSAPASSLTTNSFLDESTAATSPLTVFFAFWVESVDALDCRAVVARPSVAIERIREIARRHFFISSYSLLY